MYNQNELDYICNLLNISWITVHKWTINKSIKCGNDINYYLLDISGKPLDITHNHSKLIEWPKNYQGNSIKYDAFRREYFI